MADNIRKRKLQLWRNNNVLPNLATAKTAMESLENVSDGEILLARYYAGTVVKSVMGIKHTINGNGMTFLEDVTESSATIDAVKAELDATQAGAGLSENGNYVPSNNATANKIIGDATSIMDALEKAAEVLGTDYTMTNDPSKVVTLVKRENGIISTETTNVEDLLLTGYALNSEKTGFIAATDTIEDAFNKVENSIRETGDAIMNMDCTATVEEHNGEVVTMVSQTDGKVVANKSNLTDVKMTGYEKTDDDGAITATDTLEIALSRIENNLNSSTTANNVSSSDGSITVDHQATGTDIIVNVDGTTVQKTEGTGALKSGLTIIKEDTNLEANVREQYKLAYKVGDNAAVEIVGAEPIKIYKDSSLYNVYLGHIDDTLTNADQSGESDDTAVTDGTGNTALVYIMHLENDKYKLIAVDVETFLSESEFKDGLQVNNGEVSVRIDSASETFLTVSPTGIKLSGVQDAINAAVGSFVAGNGINIETGENNARTFSMLLKSHVDGEDSNDLFSFNSNRELVLDTVWDCGEYSTETVNP